jgi:hypothetical protein
MANQSYVLHPLDAHDALQRLFLLQSPERHAVLHFGTQFIPGHVRLSPAVRRDDAFIGVSAVVDDGPNQLKISFATATDHTGPPTVNRDRWRSDPDLVVWTVVYGPSIACPGRARLE